LVTASAVATSERACRGDTAFDDRELDIAADGSFEWRLRPQGGEELTEK
jgi:hypothetical protein